MKSEMEFTSPLEKQPGIIVDILKRSYASLITSDPDHWGQEAENWEEYDNEVFQYPSTVGACIFLTFSDNQLIGFGSYDPRQKPEIGRIGHNCILPEFRGKGFGKLQILEIIRRFQSMDIKTARVSTCSHPFFIPAQRMYVDCGFTEIGRHPLEQDPRHDLIDYMKIIG